MMLHYLRNSACPKNIKTNGQHHGCAMSLTFMYPEQHPHLHYSLFFFFSTEFF